MATGSMHDEVQMICAEVKADALRVAQAKQIKSTEEQMTTPAKADSVSHHLRHKPYILSRRKVRKDGDTLNLVERPSHYIQAMKI